MGTPGGGEGDGVVAEIQNYVRRAEEWRQGASENGWASLGGGSNGNRRAGIRKKAKTS